MPHNEARRIQSHRNVLSRRQPAEAQVFLIRRGKYGLKLLRRREVNGIVKSRVCTDAAPKLA
jgi:hypothetical protein